MLELLLQNPSQQPVGIFDSGIGGLTVLKEITALMPNENVVYLGDTARRPYGVKDVNTLMQCVVENTRSLALAGAKVVVVACHTASTVVDRVKKELPVPVIDMVEPTVRVGVQAAKDGRLGLIGTTRTVGSDVYYEGIHRLDKRIGVYAKACPGFVTMVENGDLDNLSQVCSELAEMGETGINTLVLACTHFPFLRHLIAKALPDTRIIDSSRAVARRLLDVLKEKGLLNNWGKRGDIKLIFTGGEKYVFNRS